MFSNMPTKFEVKATQDEPLVFELRVGKNVLLIAAGVLLLTAYHIRKR